MSHGDSTHMFFSDANRAMINSHFSFFEKCKSLDDVAQVALEHGYRYLLESLTRDHYRYPLSQKILYCDKLVDHVKNIKCNDFVILDSSYPVVPVEHLKESWKNSGMNDDEEVNWTTELKISFDRHTYKLKPSSSYRRIVFHRQENNPMNIRIVHWTGKYTTDVDFWNALVPAKSTEAEVGNTGLSLKDPELISDLPLSPMPMIIENSSSYSQSNDQNIIQPYSSNSSSSSLSSSMDIEGNETEKSSNASSNKRQRQNFDEVAKNSSNSFPYQNAVIWCQEIHSYDVFAMNYHKVSDSRLKENFTLVKEIPNLLKKLQSIDAYKYNFIGSAIEQFGFVAQNIQKFLPELVDEDEHGYLSVEYDSMIPLHHEWIKIISNKVDDLHSGVKELLAILDDKNKLSYIKIIFEHCVQAYTSRDPRVTNISDIVAEVAQRLNGEKNLKGLKAAISNAPQATYEAWITESIKLNKSDPSKTIGGYFFHFYDAWCDQQLRLSGKGIPNIPRDYQVSIVKEAIAHKRAVISLPTGTGKTLIAAHILKHFIPGKSERKGIFVVRDRILADQQQYALRTEGHANWTVGCFMGGSAFVNDFLIPYSLLTWEGILAACDILVVTSGLFETTLKNREKQGIQFDWSLIDVIAFDEVHNTDKAHPYAVIAQKVNEHAPNIRMYGFSATPASGKSEAETIKKYEELKQKIGGHSPAEFISVDSDDPRISSFLPSIEVKLVEIEIDDEEKERVEELRASMKILISAMIQAVDNYIQTVDFEGLNTLGYFPDHRNKIGNEIMKHAEKVMDAVENNADHLKLFTTSWLISKVVMLYQAIDELDDNIFNPLLSLLAEIHRFKFHEILDLELEGCSITDAYPALKSIYNFSLNCFMVHGSKVPDRIEEIIRILEKAHVNNPDYQAIIRAETRIAAYYIQNWLRKSKNAFVKNPLLLLGQRASHGLVDSFSMRQARENMRLFKEKKSNILIATSIIQEGIDVPGCDVVICVGAVAVASGKNFNQLKGRARKKGSVFYVLAKGVEDIMYYQKGKNEAANQERANEMMMKLKDFKR